MNADAEIAVARYSVASEPWDRKYGNHRARVQVTSPADAVWVRIPWRRRDHQPDQKAVLVVNASTGKELANVVPIHVRREYGDIVFQPVADSPEYHVYYLPSQLSGWEYMPDLTYAPPQRRADEAWLEMHRLPSGDLSSMTQAELIDIQAIDELHRFDPMEVIATQSEVEELLGTHPHKQYLVFPEDRAYPIRMTGDLPARWIEHVPADTFSGEAQRGEFYTFQVGLYACREEVTGLAVSSTALTQSNGESVISGDTLRCFNLGGINEAGETFTRTITVSQGQVQALWFGIAIPENAVPGAYQGTLTLSPDGLEPTSIRLQIEVNEQVQTDAGDSELWRHSRLRWLDSMLAQDDEVTEGYTPLEVKGNCIECLGREVSLSDAGLPASIRSRFTPELTGLHDDAREILAEPMCLLVETDQGTVEWESSGLLFTGQAAGVVEWTAHSTADALTLSCSGKMEFDGHMTYELDLSARETTSVRDIRLEIPLCSDAAQYLMGMGHKGGHCPEAFDWHWDVDSKHQDSVWIGDVNAGLQLKLKAENYVRPLVNIYYKHQPLNLPTSWGNDGLGGCRLEQRGDVVLLCAYTGECTLEPGESLSLDFTLLLTPFKPIEPCKHWPQRYYHQYGVIDQALEAGANIVNIHHANETNPFINYPFLRVEAMRDYIHDLHEHGLKGKIYYTVRELSTRVEELWALRSLGDEIFVEGPGGGASWLQEHLDSDYIPAWYDPTWQDAAIITQGVSRWNNYMVEGLAWLLEHVEIDGLYIDDMSYGRDVMKRVRKVLDRLRPGSLIDLHSWNHFNDRAGFANCANLYLENLPYVDRMWFGEGFDYDESPDYWLIEISGIVFGQMGEMLQNGGNPWRGMVYGMTARLPWSGNPAPLWKLWDEFGIQDAEMIGYWSLNCPVRTNHADILATVYHRPDRTLISLASWAEVSVECMLTIDWEALGLDPDAANISAPSVEGFQDAASFGLGDSIPVAPGRGWLLVITG